MNKCPICGEQEIIKPFGSVGAYYACPNGHSYVQGGTGGIIGQYPSISPAIQKQMKRDGN